MNILDPYEVPAMQPWWVTYAIRWRGKVYPGHVRVLASDPDDASSQIWRRLEMIRIASDREPGGRTEARIVRIFLDKKASAG